MKRGVWGGGGGGGWERLSTHGSLLEDLLPRQVVRAEHAAQDADCDLKQVDVARHRKGQLVLHPLLGLFVL